MKDEVFTSAQEARIVALFQAELQRIGLLGHWEIEDGPDAIARWIQPTGVLVPAVPPERASHDDSLDKILDPLA